MLRIQRILLSLSLALHLWTVSGFAEEPTFGLEPTFSNRELWEGDLDEDGTDSAPHRDAFKKFYELTLENCKKFKDCTIEAYLDRYGNPGYRVIYANGWSHLISLDPGVIETPTRAGTLADFEKNLSYLKRDLFDVAHKIGLLAGHPLYNGSCHVNIGLSVFEGNLLYFRNFIVDLANHPELARGILENDPWNSPTIDDLSLEQRLKFSEVIKRVDNGNIGTIESLVDAINKEVYYKNPAGYEPTEKYQSTNLTSINSTTPTRQWRMELRGVRSLKSAEEMLMVMKLFRARLEYIKAKDKPIRLQINLKTEGFRMRENKKKIKAFKRYVRQSDLSWKDFKQVMPQKLISCDKVLRGKHGKK